MAVTLWAVLGMVLILLGLPLAFVVGWGNYLVGGGVAFLIVAAVEWAWDRSVASAPEVDDIHDLP